MKTFFAGLFFAIYAGTLAAASQDDDFMAMRQAFQAGDSARVAAYAQRLRGYVLEPYAIYYQLRPQLENTDASEETVNAFLKRYQDSPLSDRLQGEWLKTLGETQQWDLFAEAYPNVINKDTELICYSLQQRLAANDNSAFAEVRPLWFNARDLPESCTPLFDALVTAGVLTVEDVWARLRLALEAGSVSVAKRINEYLPENQALNERRLTSATENPLRYLEKHRREIGTRADREIALFAILRLLRSSPDQAYAYWPRIREQFSEAEHSYFLVQLADQAARRLNPRALGWFMEAASTSAPVALSDAQLGWKTRAALRAGDWNLVLESIEAMSTPEQQTGVWRYWKARALKSRGKTTEANVILAPLSTEHNFYGQLAEEELGVTIGTPAESYKPSKKEIAATERLPGIKRALALYRLNLRTEATREWVWAIRDFDDHRLLAAAEVARRHGIYDRAINTAEKTIKDHDFSLRFLAPHRDAMRDILKQQELDEAWVYGLIRQESRFISDARSSAGAMGLMQLMPGTAKWVSKKMGVRKYRPALVTEVNTNLKLGTYYLKHVLTLSDNQPLLASAGYNAGPGRMSQWRDEKQPLEGAIYAETIPFNETRDYVKKVLSNSMYYARSFGHQVTALKSRLGIVASRSGGEKFSEEK
ncbi:lytic transglycosylase domain-containing protein [Nitrosovibrio sp. Nv6]|uniref:lytic transglycosylase domain-containing protein n=1 Tax=Nitrosovibrio sp. Nv6 TaxID=1855340 RepID=UPI0008C62939|nr:lytic transglycosylase domain-containing protein [Nitrosovibrio sp. Nv6]SEP24955.1 soluble lytic murein transglycosylase [Nitrosovibrio sp. Nv6]